MMSSGADGQLQPAEVQEANHAATKGWHNVLK
jgi:hypothetical protein